MISTSFMSGGGFMKCIPITRSGRFTAAPMAVMLIENLAARFDPGRYQDGYRDAVLKLVDAKLADQPLERAPAPAVAQITDLMAALKASVEAASLRRQAADPEGELPGRAVAARRRRAS